MKTKELTSLKEMLAVFPVLLHMYPDMTYDEYAKILPDRVAGGYRMLGVFDGDICVCAGGFWVGFRFYCGRFIQLDNMVTIPEYRSKGVGKLTTDWIKETGKKESCERVLIDTYVENFEAHRFFFREGFIIRGYHLNYNLKATE